MSSALTTTTTNAPPVQFAGGVNPFLKVTKEDGAADGQFARFNGKTGIYIFGDNEKLENGTEVVVDFLSGKRVWLGFDGDNKPHRGPEVPLASGQDFPPAPEKAGVRWNKQYVVGMTTMDGKQLIYSGKADNGYRPIVKLCQDWARQAPMKGWALPIVTIDSVERKSEVEETQADGSKRKVKVTYYAEVFTISGWITPAELEELRAGSAAPEDDNDAGDHDDGTVEVIPPAPQAASLTGRRPGRFGRA